jgi:hypothetical protein
VIVRRGWKNDAVAAIEQFVRLQNTPLRLTILDLRRRRTARDRLGERGWTRSTRRAEHARTFRSPAYVGFDLATLGASHRANVRRRIRALEQKFDVRFDAVTTETERRVAMPALMGTTHAASTQGTAFGSHATRAFHDEVTRARPRARLAAVYLLRLNGELPQ